MLGSLRETIRENEELHAQLLVQAREAGVHDERERMAREMPGARRGREPRAGRAADADGGVRAPRRRPRGPSRPGTG